jgi:ABC-type nitrate/sulfonate/bicarbonate transport system permease component
MIGAIVIELEASIVGLGHLLQSYSQALQLAPYFIAVLLLGLFSILFSTVLKRLQRWATMPWASTPRYARRH